MNGPTLHEAVERTNGENQPLCDMPMHKLAQALTRAEEDGDNDAIEQISDVLIEKLVVAEASYHQRQSANRPETTTVETWNNALSDELWDSVIYYSDIESGQSIKPLKFESQQLTVEPKHLPKENSHEPARLSVAASHISLPRKQPEGEPPLENGDTVLQDDETGIYGVFDGVSGGVDTRAKNAERAQKASNAAAQAVAAHYETYTTDPSSEEEALDRATAALVSARDGVKEEGDGGSTTATILKIEYIRRQPYLVGAHAGDSQLLLQEGADKSVEEIFTNQSQAEILEHGLFHDAASGLSERDEFWIRPLKAGTRAVLCSDGITGDKEPQFLTDEEKQQAFNATDPHRAASMLVAFSKKNDDKSVVVVDVLEKTPYRRTPQAIVAPDGTPPQHEKRRKRKWTAVLGAIALAGVATALLTSTLSKDGGGGDHVKPASPPPARTQAPSAPPQAKQEAPGKAHQQPNERAEQAIGKRILRLEQKGTTIWGQTAHYLHQNAYLTASPTVNNAIIDSVKDDVLIQQGVSEEAAHDLPVGYTFTIPRFSLKEARQLKTRLMP